MMWTNQSKDKVLTETVDFHNFKGFEIDGHPGESKVTVTVDPGKTKSLLVRQTAFEGQMSFKCEHEIGVLTDAGKI